MVLMRKIKENLILVNQDNIIAYNLTDKSDQTEKIPDPEISGDLSKSQIESLKKETRKICSVEASVNGDYIAVSTENKQVVVYDKKFSVVKNFLIPRIASKVIFTNTNDIVVADKTGDVYLYKFDDEKNEPTTLLGQLSIILDIVISECGKYIITCDRDEKIRVSCFPNAYNIVSYCLGHQEFVTKLRLANDNNLVSTSGDGTVRFWNYLKGEQVGIIDTREHIDDRLLERFRKEMDTESVEITSLPVTDIQLDQNEEILALSIHMFHGILLYWANLKSMRFSFIYKVTTSCFPVFLMQDSLYLVLSDNLYVWNLDSKKLQLENSFQMLYEKYKDVLSDTFKINDLSMLYKRRFDNVQEYLQRKKQRLEAK